MSKYLSPMVHADGTECRTPNPDPFKIMVMSAFPSQTYYCGHDQMIYQKPVED